MLATSLVVLAAVAGADVALDEDERRGAARRALLRLAAGGDPARGLDLNGPGGRASWRRSSATPTGSSSSRTACAAGAPGRRASRT